jgi:hypothetical protein
VDGRLDEPAWRAARWSEPFMDIVGAEGPTPTWRTQVKLLWDETFLYVGANLEEPHLWATLTERDAVIYRDNDFEVFIDPNGDTQDYFEIEINAMGTVWDLMLPKPYRDRGSAVTSWDAEGLGAAVHLDGTINDPSDRDRGWTVEVAVPWSALRLRPPGDGDHWRLNFSRVQWYLDVVGRAYQKAVDPSTGESLPEENWVWSPQGAVNMHMPERWGIVQFSEAVVGRGPVSVRPPRDPVPHWALREVYYAQRRYRQEHGRYAATLEELGVRAIVTTDGRPIEVGMEGSADGFEATAVGLTGEAQWHIRQDGKLWRHD